MSISRRHFLAALAAVVVLGGQSVAMAQEDLHVIVHPTNEIGAMSPDDIRGIFMGTQTYWRGQKSITPILRPEALDAGKLFFKNVLHMTPARFRHHWSGLELSGRGLTPSTIARAEDVATLVQSNPGAVSVVTAAELAGLKAKFTVKSIPLKE